MTRQSKKRVLLAGGAALVCAIAALLFHIPGSTPYFDRESHTYTQVVLRQGDACQRREVTIDDPETVAAIASYLDGFTYSYRAPFYNGLTMTLVLEGEEGARQVQLSPYGVVDPAESLVYNNAGPYFRALFDWMMEE